VSRTGWLQWSLGFLAGAVLASYLALSCGVGRAQSPEVAFALDHAALEQHVSPGCLRRIAWRESRFLPWVDNFQGSGAAGLMQFLAGTWRAFAGQAGYDPHPGARYDAWQAAHVAAWMIARPWTGGLRHWGGTC
jgi:soluble lytic murein transglycosylase-like protein